MVGSEGKMRDAAEHQEWKGGLQAFKFGSGAGNGADGKLEIAQPAVILSGVGRV